MLLVGHGCMKMGSSRLHCINVLSNQDGIVKKVVGDHKPFMDTESYFVDAKLYMTKKANEVKVELCEELKGNQKGKQDEIVTESLIGLTTSLTKIDAIKTTSPFVHSNQMMLPNMEIFQIARS